MNVIQARDGEAGGVNEILIGAARPCLHLVLRAELPTLPFCLEQELLQEAQPVITGQGGGEGDGGGRGEGGGFPLKNLFTTLATFTPPLTALPAHVCLP